MKPNVNIIKLNEWDKIFSPDFGLVLESGNYYIYKINATYFQFNILIIYYCK